MKSVFQLLFCYFWLLVIHSVQARVILNWQQLNKPKHMKQYFAWSGHVIIQSDALEWHNPIKKTPSSYNVAITDMNARYAEWFYW